MAKKPKLALENICFYNDFYCFFLLLLQQKSVHCRVVATKFYKTKIPSLILLSCWLVLPKDELFLDTKDIK